LLEYSLTIGYQLTATYRVGNKWGQCGAEVFRQTNLKGCLLDTLSKCDLGLIRGSLPSIGTTLARADFRYCHSEVLVRP